MKRYLQACSLMILLLAAVACGDKTTPENKQASVGSGQPSIFRSLSPQEAKSLIETRKDLVLVDVRSPQELYEGSIPDSQLIPFTDLAQGRTTLPTGKPILLICAVGGRSYAVGQYFSGKGYGEIYNLSGGISAWKAAGLPLQQR
ncbi:MAG: rhodanese-like domain-containing protein [Deltaproteobacteria bacterium]|nr:rhodanese-like domain-containing protein [Deltaproteobacteria bacterium]